MYIEFSNPHTCPHSLLKGQREENRRGSSKQHKGICGNSSVFWSVDRAKNIESCQPCQFFAVWVGPVFHEVAVQKALQEFGSCEVKVRTKGAEERVLWGRARKEL